MAKDTIFQSKKTWHLKGKILSFETPVVMGILNHTPDSFFDGNAYTTELALLRKVEQLLHEGAALLDVGGYSSRPGAMHITEEEELNRVIKPIQSIIKRFPEAILSIDTFRGNVAAAAINEGVCIINDISGGEIDPSIIDMAARYHVPYILTHMKGTPQTMNQYASYSDLIVEVIDYFQKKVHDLQGKGIYDIAIDPGFGFAKNKTQNFELLHHLDLFKIMEQPLMVGLSRKSLIYKTLQSTPQEALNGTTVLHTISLMKGASILRAHDVKEAMEVIKLVDQLSVE